MKRLLYILFIIELFSQQLLALRRIHRMTMSTHIHNDVTNSIDNYDVAVIGGGIAGTALSFLLQTQQQCKVVLIDSRANSTGTWYPNYGEWRDEWHTLSDRMKFPELKECTTTEWEITDCFLGGSYDVPMNERLTLQRPYIRVDRIKLQSILRTKYAEGGGVSITAKLNSQRIAPNLFNHNLIHDSTGSSLTLDNGQKIRARIVVDATGLESRLTARESPLLARGNNKSYNIGYQIAYGYIAHVTSLGPYNLNAMTLFDYR